jgi:2-polyprenyl-3-methyl-5-hydroxy-6-metoxy-1,4-benzoquinol methylase
MSDETNSYLHHLVRTGSTALGQEQLHPNRLHSLPEDREAKIVDVGCSWGALLLSLWNAGYTNLYGVERDKELAAEAERRCGIAAGRIRITHQDAIEFFEQTSEVFDRVLVFHVLEHFPEAAGKRLLNAIRQRLTSRGRVVIEVPNLACITSVNMQFSDITHLTGFTEYSLSQVLDNVGFTTVRIECPKPPLKLWRLGRGNSGIGWHANRALHQLLYGITNSGPRPTCVSPALLITAGISGDNELRR